LTLRTEKIAKELDKLEKPKPVKKPKVKAKPKVTNTMFLSLHSLHGVRWKQVFGANGGSPEGDRS